MSKIHISYNQIHKIMENLSSEILNTFKPDLIIAITGGGLIPSRMMRTYLKCDILCVGVKLYNADDSRNNKIIKYQWLEHDLENKKILIVDEVDDTRTTLKYVIEEINKLNPKSMAVAVIHNKLKEKHSDIPDYCKYFVGQHIADRWIVYPWESKNIEEHEKRCIKN